MKNNIAAIRKQKGVSQQRLAEMVDAHWITISKLERGVMQLTLSWVERIAAALGVTANDLISDTMDSDVISIYGTIDETPYLNVPHFVHQAEILRPSNLDIYSYWVAVTGPILLPMFKSGDFIKFMESDPKRPNDYVGRLVLLTEKNFTVASIGILEGATDTAIDVRFPTGTLRKSIPTTAFGVAVEARFMVPELQRGWAHPKK